METALSLVLSLLLVSSCSGQGSCNGKNCPEYEVIERSKNFETREYVSTTWIRAKLQGDSPRDFLSANRELKAFTKDQPGLDNTWPVLINHTKDDQLWLCWFVPPGRNLVPSSTVEVFNLPNSTFYVRTFGGTPSISAGQSNTKVLLAALEKDCDLKSVEYSGAGYESFWALTHHNEVWINPTFAC